MACLVTILAGFSAVLGTQTAASGMMLVSQGYVATYTAYRCDITGVSPSERATARACRTGILRHTWGIALPSCDTQGVSQPAICDTAVLSQMAGLNLEQQTRMARYAWLANNCRDIGWPGMAAHRSMINSELKPVCSPG